MTRITKAIIKQKKATTMNPNMSQKSKIRKKMKTQAKVQLRDLKSKKDPKGGKLSKGAELSKDCCTGSHYPVATIDVL
jgi:hypothetical protein